MVASGVDGGSPVGEDVVSVDERPAIRHIYGAMADDYLRAHGDELAHSPWDRAIIDDFLGAVPVGGRVADLGCGPGHVTTHLRRGGLTPVGFDLTPTMLRVARTTAPILALVGAEVIRLPVRDGSFAGALARYVVHHIDRESLPRVLTEVRRVLQPEAPFLLVAQGGDGERVVEQEHAGTRERVTVTLYAADELATALASTGFDVTWTRQRDPRPDEYPATKLAVAATAV